MNNVVSKVIVFTAGSVVGSIVTWKIVKSKYEKYADEEIKKVVEYYSKKAEEKPIEKVDDETGEPFMGFPSKVKPDLEEYYNRIKDLGYISGNDISEKVEPVTMAGPFVISPSEFDENDYDTVSYKYYADGILTDEMDEIVEDVDGTVGYESLKHFGEYEDDSVFVRNDKRQIDYEILLVDEDYASVKGIYPYPVDEDK